MSTQAIDSFRGDYEFLSNFHLHRIHYEGEWWPSNEHAFQGMKTPDPTQRLEIQQAPTPGAAKRLGRRVTLRSGWHQYWRYVTMEDLVGVKFVPDTELAFNLLSTGTRPLIERNTHHDQTWGCCRCGRPACLDPGMNLLGWLLMRQRDLLGAGI